MQERRHSLDLFEMERAEFEAIKHVRKNHVLIKVDINTDKTRSGIWLPDKEWDFGAGKHAERVGIVEKLPAGLQCGYGNDPSNITWETELELEIGDKVWFDHIEALNSEGIKVPKYSDGLVVGYDKYKFINYTSIIVAIRGEKIIPVNGNVLFEHVKEKIKLGVYEKEVMDIGHGIVKHIGKPIKKYYAIVPRNQFKMEQEDDLELEVGMKVLFTKKYAMSMRYYLEEPMHSVFPDKNMLVAQRRRIAYVY